MFKKFIAIFISVLLLMSLIMATPASAIGNLKYENVALNATVTSDYAIAGGASGYTKPAWDSKQLVDGKTSTVWGMISHIPSLSSKGFTNPSKKEDEPFFVVDLGSPKVVSGVGLYPVVYTSTMMQDNRHVNFEIWASNDNVNYVKLYDSAEAGLTKDNYPSGKQKDIYFNNTTAYRYVKFQGTYKTEYRFWEFMVYSPSNDGKKAVEVCCWDPAVNNNKFIWMNGTTLYVTAHVASNTGSTKEVWFWGALYDEKENLIAYTGLNNLGAWIPNSANAPNHPGREYSKSFTNFFASSEPVDGKYVLADNYKDVKTIKVFVWDKDDMTPIYSVERDIEDIITVPVSDQE